MAKGLVTWSTTAATNASADSTINWAEGQAPSSVNDSARALMASAAMWRDDTNGSITTGGSASAYTVTSNQAFASLAAMNNAVIAFVPHATNTASPTLSVDGLTAKKIRFDTGVDIQDGVLVEGTPYTVTYYNSVGEFILHGLAGAMWMCPIASGFDYWGTTAPTSHFAFPSGQAISRTTYSALFDKIGTTHGVGDGTTTFNLPDKRGRVSVGKDDMNGSAASRVTTGGSSIDGATLGAAGGAQTVTVSQANLPDVTFAGSTSGNLSVPFQYNNDIGINYQSGGNQTGVSNIGGGFLNNGQTTGSLGVSVSSGGSGTAVNKMPPAIVCNYIMRII